MTQEDRDKVTALESLMAAIHRVTTTIQMLDDPQADPALVAARLEIHEAALRRCLASFTY